MTQAMKKIKLKISIKFAIIIMVISLLGIGILAYLSFYQAKQIFTENSIQLLDRNIEKYESSVKDSINVLRYDITMLAFNASVLGFLRAYHDPNKYDEKSNKTYGQFKTEIIALFNLIMSQNKSYFQIRIIDAKTGMELIKVIKNGNKIVNIKDSDLQNKYSSNYVQGVLKQEKDIFISDINLNREHKTIEFPIKPTIRIAKLIKIRNQNAGIVVINSNIKILFKFKKLRETPEIQSFVTNQHGDYILNTVEPFKEFGQEFGKDYKIYKDFKVLKPLFFSKKEKIIYNDKKHILEAKKIFISNDKFIVIAKNTISSLFEQKSRKYILNLIFYIIIITFFITIVTAIIARMLTKPIVELSNIANKIAITKGEEDIPINIESNDEIGDLANSFKMMLEALVNSKKEIEQFASKLEEEVSKKTKELQELNKNLQKNVEEKIAEIRKKDKALLQQSKMAAMGEMIGAIAHQWRQPLNSLALNIQLLVDLVENNELTLEEIEDFVEKNMKTIQFMSKTIDDFRNFFREDKEKTAFDIKEAIEATISLQKDQLNSHNIELQTELKSMKAYGFKNEFMQVILNIISNARDVILEKQRHDKNFKGLIKVKNELENSMIVVRIWDNAGGIPENIIDRIFEPYFTTKDQGKGTGMGLYMSKEIMNNMSGGIEVRNVNNGVEFIVRIPAWKE